MFRIPGIRMIYEEYKGGEDVHIVFHIGGLAKGQGIGVAGHEWIGWSPLHSLLLLVRLRGEGARHVDVWNLSLASLAM